MAILVAFKLQDWWVRGDGDTIFAPSFRSLHVHDLVPPKTSCRMISKTSAPLFLLGLLPLSLALQCHQCTSFTDTQCGDPFHYEPARAGDKPVPKTMEYLKNCPSDGKNYTICRKIYQNVRGDVRIIRSCGYEEYKNDCYKTVLEEYNTYVCQCFEDGCNGAPRGTAASSLAATLAMAVLAVMFK